MQYDSLWSNTKTFFPLLCDYLLDHPDVADRALVIGAADGKFVLPLCGMGKSVTAVEIDEKCIEGGEFTADGQQTVRCPGLRAKVAAHGFTKSVQVTRMDFQDFACPADFDIAFTSCSWHYSLNEAFGVEKFVSKMASLVRSGGVLCAEYMMPIEAQHQRLKRYLREGELRALLPGGWSIVTEFYTEPFREGPHAGNPAWHAHRMGFLLARRSGS
jgi:SAM-dependent methyltransferase